MRSFAEKKKVVLYIFFVKVICPVSESERKWRNYILHCLIS